MKTAALTSPVRTGADRLLSDAQELIRNKRIAVLTNHTGRVAGGKHIIDALAESGIAEIAALFGPEHGIFGNTPDGDVVDNALHPKHHIPIYSLYGKVHKPLPEMLAGIDVLVCDIQDVGVRFYTFISTVALAMEAAAECGMTFVILDRPNPIRGLAFDGPVRETPLRSFVGWMPIPVTYGMTMGELACLWNGERWLANGIQARLEVVKMDGWHRSAWYDETGLAWVPPSPNMPRLSTAVVYPGLCFLEGTTVAEGRGTMFPFELIGAPWADPDRIIGRLQDYRLPGVQFSAEQFTPVEIPGVASAPKFERKICQGIRIRVTDRDRVQPVHLGVALLAAFKAVHPTETVLEHRRFDILTGHRDVRRKLEAGVPPEEICDGWRDELLQFGELREKYLLYS